MIGKWVIRVKSGMDWPERGKAHIVESEIAERVVTRCGRELPLSTERGHLEEYVARRMERRCRQCEPLFV